MSIRQALDTLFETLQRAGASPAALFADGLPEREIADKLAGLPGRAASEVLEYFAWRNGLRLDRDMDSELFPGGIPLSLDDALAQYGMQRDIADQIARQTGLPSSTLWNERWLPIFHDGGGNFHVTILAPDPVDTAPVYAVDNEGRGAADLAFDSLTALIHTANGCWKAGAFAPAAGGLIEEDRPAAAAIIRAHNPERIKRASAWIDRR